jgi:hypothetical protein
MGCLSMNTQKGLSNVCYAKPKPSNTTCFRCMSLNKEMMMETRTKYTSSNHHTTIANHYIQSLDGDSSRGQ